MEVLPTAPLEDLMHSHRSLSQLWERSSLQGVSPPRQPENSDRYPVRAMRRCLRQAAEAGDLVALSAFPIIVKGQRNVHEPLPFSLFKDLKKSIRENGLQSPHTNGLFQAITESYRIAPCDWMALARTVLTPAQFTVWHSEYSQRAIHQVAEILLSPSLCCLRLVILLPLRIKPGFIFMLLIKVLRLLSEP